MVILKAVKEGIFNSIYQKVGSIESRCLFQAAAFVLQSSFNTFAPDLKD